MKKRRTTEEKTAFRSNLSIKFFEGLREVTQDREIDIVTIQVILKKKPDFTKVGMFKVNSIIK